MVFVLYVILTVARAGNQIVDEMGVEVSSFVMINEKHAKLM
jgi:hypothetical protein